MVTQSFVDTLDQIRIMLCLYLAYPLSWILSNVVSGTTPRHIFATISGMALQVYMFREQVVHTLTMTLITYLVMNVVPRN